MVNFNFEKVVFYIIREGIVGSSLQSGVIE